MNAAGTDDFCELGVFWLTTVIVFAIVGYSFILGLLEFTKQIGVVAFALITVAIFILSKLCFKQLDYLFWSVPSAFMFVSFLRYKHREVKHQKSTLCWWQ